jgi:hypothetical protein
MKNSIQFSPTLINLYNYRILALIILISLTLINCTSVEKTSVKKTRSKSQKVAKTKFVLIPLKASNTFTVLELED